MDICKKRSRDCGFYTPNTRKNGLFILIRCFIAIGLPTVVKLEQFIDVSFCISDQRKTFRNTNHRWCLEEIDVPDRKRFGDFARRSSTHPSPKLRVFEILEEALSSGTARAGKVDLFTVFSQRWKLQENRKCAQKWENGENGSKEVRMQISNVNECCLYIS